jgi:hypothetical protein
MMDASRVSGAQRVYRRPENLNSLSGNLWRTGEDETGNRYALVFPAILKVAKRSYRAQ